MNRWSRAVHGMAALLLGLALAGPASALPAPPPPITTSAAEDAALTARQVVVRYGGAGKETVAILDIAAPPRSVMAAVMDLPPRIREISGMQSVDVYERAPGRVGARWIGGVGFLTITFHILYEFDLDAGWCVYRLDTTKENTITSSTGSYQVYAHGGGSRMVYRTVSEGGGATPESLRKRLAEQSARQMMEGIRKRSERPAG